MAKQTINIGTVAGDGTGDGLRTAMDKVNDNFDEVYAADVTAAAHIASTSNPHSVTKSQVGLGNCDNTSDANKPISTATQTALDLKAPLASPALTGTPTAPTAAGATNTTQIATTAFVRQEINALVDGAPAALDTLNELAAAINDDASYAATVTTALSGKAAAADLTSHTSNTSNPHSVTKSQVGLGNCDNTSDADKPISSATQTALDGKAATNRKLDDFGACDDNTDLDATTGAHGLMSKADKSKLNAIEAAADVTDAGNVGAAIHGATEKTTPVNADKIAIIDSEATNVLKWLSWTNVKATLKTYFDTLYAAASHTHALSALTQSSATSGQVAAWNGSAWAPATPSGGGSSISTPKVCYVQTTGNDGTAAVGNPALPFATSQAAFDAGIALNDIFSIHFGVGSHAGITVAADMVHICSLKGEGFGVSVVNEIAGNGAAGSTGAEDSPGTPGGAGKTLLFDSDGTVDVTSILSQGGQGGQGGSGTTGGNGGDGGANGIMRLRGVRGSGLCASEGGGGGAGGGGSGIAGGLGGGAYVTLFQCLFGGSVYIGTGSGTSAGIVRVSQCVAGGDINVIAGGGYVHQCNATSFSVTGGPTEAGNTTGANAHLLA